MSSKEVRLLGEAKGTTVLDSGLKRNLVLLFLVAQVRALSDPRPPTPTPTCLKQVWSGASIACKFFLGSETEKNVTVIKRFTAE
jgi:hypothetical protein